MLPDRTWPSVTSWHVSMHRGCNTGHRADPDACPARVELAGSIQWKAQWSHRSSKRRQPDKRASKAGQQTGDPMSPRAHDRRHPVILTLFDSTTPVRHPGDLGNRLSEDSRDDTSLKEIGRFPNSRALRGESDVRDAMSTT
ncbi:hypothetical protein Sjap_018705 [Stephania japonica]|uniref:Uncharacterized protein n=1 Tax=Stephania japonica TaxID=461633 RepID=A0AAP0I8K7_9MAGN